MESNISSSFCDCGQMFYIVNNSNFEQLLYYINQNNTDVTGSTLIHYLKKNIDFAESHENFCCAITKISRQNSERHFWLPMLFYYYNFKWVRVAIESIKSSTVISRRKTFKISLSYIENASPEGD